MKLTEQSLENYSVMLATGSPVPGGGTGAALTAALGASLITMAARITKEKPGFTEHEENLERIADNADKLRSAFLSLVDKDAAVYQQYTMAAGTTAEPDALRCCVEPPLEMLEHTATALRLARQLAAAYYPPVASDIGIAALNLEAAAKGALLTIYANLKHIKDKTFVTETLEKSRSLLASAETDAAALYALTRSHIET
jgi:formiminotetrahydrofolate cyclodeaminase